MNKETMLSLLRTLLTSVGMFFIGKNLLGSQVDENILQLLVGIAMTLVSVIWSVTDKSLKVEMVQSLLRQVVIGIGGLLVAKGSLKPQMIEQILGLIAAFMPFLESVLMRKKNVAINNGTIDPTKLKQ